LAGRRIRKTQVEYGWKSTEVGVKRMRRTYALTVSQKKKYRGAGGAAKTESWNEVDDDGRR